MNTLPSVANLRDKNTYLSTARAYTSEISMTKDGKRGWQVIAVIDVFNIRTGDVTKSYEFCHYMWQNNIDRASNIVNKMNRELQDKKGFNYFNESPYWFSMAKKQEVYNPEDKPIFVRAHYRNHAY